MANYLVTDTELTSVANAIRTKGGTTAQLSFPTGFVSAVNAISSSDANIEFLYEGSLGKIVEDSGTATDVGTINFSDYISNYSTFVIVVTSDAESGVLGMLGHIGFVSGSSPKKSYLNISTLIIGEDAQYGIYMYAASGSAYTLSLRAKYSATYGAINANYYYRIYGVSYGKAD